MTVVAALLDPPIDGLVLSDLPATSPLSTGEATALYHAMAGDVLRAVEASGGDLLVNYRPRDLLPEAYQDDEVDPEAAVRALAVEALESPDDARFEVQVGSTFSARAGNTVTHLLEREEEASVAVVDGTAPMLARTHIDSAAMKLRRSPVVLGPATGGRCAYAAFAEPIDFADAFEPPAIETLTERAVAAGHDVDFLPLLPAVETGDDLATLVSLLHARRAARRIVPARTTALVEELGLSVAVEDGDRRVVRDGA